MGEFLKDFAGEYGKEFIRVAWKDQGLMDGLNRGPERLDKQLMALMEYYAPQVENWMKDNAPWTDRTGNARNGLATRAFEDSSAKGLILYGQVPYQIWLEVRWSGKYGIIVPAMEEWGPRVMAGAKGLLGRI